MEASTFSAGTTADGLLGNTANFVATLITSIGFYTCLIALICRENWQGRRTSRLVLVGMSALLLGLCIGYDINVVNLDILPLITGCFGLLQSLAQA